ncbi:MAG: hypothetical protein SVR94_07310, partial [Pseudomonadota bacterium]|nr:hypothetical protein [Pseudomonadota bacterium]
IWNAAGLKTTNEACWLLGDKKFIHKPKHMIRGNHKLRQHDEIMLRRDTSVPALTRLESSLVTFLDMVPIVFFKLIWSAYKKFRNPFKHSEM